jgi:excinuclease UvrABC nuclease subunit
MAGLQGISKPREDQLNTAFTTTTKLSEATTEDILHTTAIDEE